MDALNARPTSGSIIAVVGVGGAGCNAVANMWRMRIDGVSYIACNTDRKSLDANPAPCKVCLGSDGLGAGNDPANGRAAAIASYDEVRFQLASTGCRMAFIAAGMGGGTGTGAAPVIAKLAREMGLLTVGIVTSPLAGEGRPRWQQAMEAIALLETYVDALLVIDNDNVVDTYDDLPLEEAFGRADDVLATAARGIAEIVTRQSNLVGTDFADVATVMRNCGRAHMSVTSASGENRVEEAIRAALCSPLLGRTRIAGAKHILINLSTADSRDLKARELKHLLERIQQFANDGRAVEGLSATNIIWGTSVNERMEPGVLELVIIATGFEAPPPQPAPIPAFEEPEGPAEAGKGDEETAGEETGEEAPDAVPAPEEDPERAAERKRSAEAASVEAVPETGNEVPDNEEIDVEEPGNETAGTRDEVSAAAVWTQLSRRVTQFVEKVFDAGKDTPM